MSIFIIDLQRVAVQTTTVEIEADSPAAAAEIALAIAGDIDFSGKEKEADYSVTYIQKRRLSGERIVERDKIIFGENRPNWFECHNVVRFAQLSLPELEQLVDKKYIELHENQNNSPTTAEFLAFMRQFPATTAHGYVVSPERIDERVTLEGLEVKATDVTPVLLRAFVSLCNGADEFYCDDNGDLYAWWD
jgi:hypothetical protein